MTAAGFAVLAVILAALVAVAVLWWRDRRGAVSDAWRERAGAEAVRADGAEEVAENVAADALEQQAAIQKEQRDAATERLAHPRPGARQRVQGRWKRADDSGGADVPAGDAGAVSDPATGGAGSGATGNPKLRGRR